VVSINLIALSSLKHQELIFLVSLWTLALKPALAIHRRDAEDAEVAQSHSLDLGRCDGVGCQKLEVAHGALLSLPRYLYGFLCALSAASASLR
jgi:hypothetical protein